MEFANILDAACLGKNLSTAARRYRAGLVEASWEFPHLLSESRPHYCLRYNAYNGKDGSTTARKDLTLLIDEKHFLLNRIYEASIGQKLARKFQSVSWLFYRQRLTK